MADAARPESPAASDNLARTRDRAAPKSARIKSGYSAEKSAPACASLRPRDADLLHQLAPAVDLVVEVTLQFFWRCRVVRDQPHFYDRLLHVWLSHDGFEFLVELVHDFFWSSGRRHYHVPGHRLKILKSKFVERRHVRHGGDAGERRDRKRFELAGGDERRRESRIGEHHLDVAGDDVVGRR